MKACAILLWLAASCGAWAAEAPAPRDERDPFEVVVIEEGQFVTRRGDEAVIQLLTDLGDFPPESKASEGEIASDIRRAQQWFVQGSPRLRARVAQTLLAWNPHACRLSGDAGYRMWASCTPEEFEAKHYLVGVALPGATDEQRREIFDWLERYAQPAYTQALLRNMQELAYPRSYNGAPDEDEWRPMSFLYGDLPAEDCDRLLPFLRSLYAQTTRVLARVADEGETHAYVRAEGIVAGLLPSTPAGMEQLFAWLSCDEKKLDESSLDQMVGRWNDFLKTARIPEERRLEMYERASTCQGFVEAMLLSGSPRHWAPLKEPGIGEPDRVRRWQVAQERFWERVDQQVYNPDVRVQERAVTHRLSLSDYKRLARALRDMPVAPDVRRRAVELAKARHARQLAEMVNAKKPEQEIARLKAHLAQKEEAFIRAVLPPETDK